MAKSSSPASSELRLLTTTFVGALIVLCLYWGQVIFIPVALAIYLSFLLGPIVSGLQRRGLGRTPAAVGVVLLVGVFLGGVCWMVTHEFSGLVEELPSYSGNIRERIHDLQSTTGAGPVQAVERLLKELSGQSKPSPAAESPNESAGDSHREPAPPTPGSAKSDAARPTLELTPEAPKTPSNSNPLPVEVTPASPPWLSHLPLFLSSAAEMLGGLVLTLVLIMFMLVKREDLRNRVIWLFGSGHLTYSTRAVDDATQRISRFFARQAMINAGFGCVIGVGLSLIGVRYAFLWGFFGALLRYIPYVGPVIASVPPLLVSLAMSSGWASPILVLALFVVVESVCGNVIEPSVFGRSLGVSEVGLLVMSAFWAFLWGPIGLVLANPLTVCLVVLGKNVPQMEIFSVLLGDEPALPPDVSFYQRLYARDQDEALELVVAYLRTNPAEQVYDDLLIPALTMMKCDRERDELTDEDERFIVEAMRELLTEIDTRPTKNGQTTGAAPQPAASNGQAPDTVLPKARVLAAPARDAADELALEMLRRLLDPEKWDLEIAPQEMLSSELVEEADRTRPGVLCLASLPSGGLARTRYLCKRLRNRLPEMRIIVGRWGLKAGIEANAEQLREAGVDEVDVTLLATRTRLTAWFGFLSHVAPAEPEPAQREPAKATA